jgi:hypothetical protein
MDSYTVQICVVGDVNDTGSPEEAEATSAAVFFPDNIFNGAGTE